tara:strand:+ start:180 stop:824 length:645 start_codon:yes stop_codon:yes gene_type:complete
MPSKKFNGNAPFGADKITSEKGVDSALARLSNQILTRSPKQSMTAGSKQTHNGIFLEPKRFKRQKKQASTSQTICELGDISPDPNNEGKFIIRPGHIQGGGDTQLIEIDNLTAVANNSVWLEIPWTANEVDDVLQAGGTMGTVTVNTGASAPLDDVPVITDLSGTAYYVIGSWDSETVWVKNGCGTVTIDFCPGGYVKGRLVTVETEDPYYYYY